MVRVNKLPQIQSKDQIENRTSQYAETAKHYLSQDLKKSGGKRWIKTAALAALTPLAAGVVAPEDAAAQCIAQPFGSVYPGFGLPVTFTAYPVGTTGSTAPFFQGPFGRAGAIPLDIYGTPAPDLWIGMEFGSGLGQYMYQTQLGVMIMLGAQAPGFGAKATPATSIVGWVPIPYGASGYSNVLNAAPVPPNAAINPVSYAPLVSASPPVFYSNNNIAATHVRNLAMVTFASAQMGTGPFAYPGPPGPVFIPLSLGGAPNPKMGFIELSVSWPPVAIGQPPPGLGIQFTIHSLGISGTPGAPVVAGDCGTLPVELVNFSAETRGQNVILQWETSAEVNNDHFKVQRSLHREEFETIGIVSGQGDIDIETQYEFEDADVLPGATYYYRLMQVDFDGRYTYSPVIAVKMPAAGALTASQAYPNPASAVSNIDLTVVAESEVSIEIYDSAGKAVRNMYSGQISGTQTIELDLSGLPTSVYYAKVIAGKEVLYRKVVVAD